MPFAASHPCYASPFQSLPFAACPLRCTFLLVPAFLWLPLDDARPIMLRSSTYALRLCPIMSNTGLSPSSNTPASFSYTKTSSVPLLSHLIWPFLIILHSLARLGHFILFALTCPPAPSRAQLRLRHARLPVPFGLPDPTRITSRLWQTMEVQHGYHPHIFLCRNHLTTPESLPRLAHSPAGCVGSHRLPRFTLLRSLSMSRAHPQPLLGFRSIPATSAFFEPVRVRQPLRAPFLQLSAEASPAPVHSTIVPTTTKIPISQLPPPRLHLLKFPRPFSAPFLTHPPPGAWQCSLPVPASILPLSI